MWCPSCRADVAAELSTDNRRMLCARCQTELAITATAASQIANLPRAIETERDARELLARWSAQNLLDVPAPAVGAGPFATPNGSGETPIARPELRFDDGRPTVPAPSSRFLDSARAKQDQSSSSPPANDQDENSRLKKRFAKKKSQASRLAAAPVRELPETPVVPVEQRTSELQPSSSHYHSTLETPHVTSAFRSHPTWIMMAGQICAYAGVGLLTCGTVLVMWNYFGGPANFLPLGWLTAAVGQMLLFLGVITLISSGLDLTVSEVAWRIDHLAEEIHHMEMALEDLEHEHRRARRRRARSQKDNSDDGPSKQAA